MKKYLLSTLLGLFGLIGFTSAGSVLWTVSEEGDILYGEDGYEYNLYDFNPGDYVSFFNFIGNCSYQVQMYNLDMTVDEIYDFSSNSSYLIPDGAEDIQITPTDYPYEDVGATCGFSYSYSSSVVNPDEGGSGIIPIVSGGGTLLSNGKDSFTPILNGLEGTILEFIPYVAYIGLGIIIAVLGFVAIRWLVNRVRAKIFDSF